MLVQVRDHIPAHVPQVWATPTDQYTCFEPVSTSICNFHSIISYIPDFCYQVRSSLCAYCPQDVLHEIPNSTLRLQCCSSCTIIPSLARSALSDGVLVSTSGSNWRPSLCTRSEVTVGDSTDRFPTELTIDSLYKKVALLLIGISTEHTRNTIYCKASSSEAADWANFSFSSERLGIMFG